MVTVEAESDAGQRPRQIEDIRGLSPEERARGFTLLAITTFLAYIVINIPQTISPNFFRDEIGMDGALNGYLIAIREVPGFLLIFVAALLLRHGMAAGHGHRPHRRRGRLLSSLPAPLLRRADHPDAHRQRRLPLLAPAPGRARALAGQARRGRERAGALPLHRVCRHHGRPAGDAGDPVRRRAHLRRSARGAGTVAARPLRRHRRSAPSSARW